MQKSQLVSLLNTFSTKEIRDFRKFINSPFFNQRKDVIQLFESLVQYIFEFQIIPDKKLLYKQVYPKSPYDDQQFRLIVSYCFKHLEEFLVIQSLDEIKNKINLSEIYRKRKLPKLFKKSIGRARHLLEKQSGRNTDYQYYYFQILLEEYYFTSGFQRTGEQNLQELNDHLDVFYFNQKLRQICLSLSHQTVYKTEYHFGMLSEIIEYIEEQNLLENPSIAIYYYVYHILTKPEEIHHFEKLKIALFSNSNIFPKSEIRDLFLLSINYCIKRLNEGNKQFEEEMFDLCKEGLRQEHLISNGMLSRFTHQNITTIGLIRKEYDWVENFIHQYKNHVEKQHRESSYSYNMARLEYARKNFDKVLSLLQKTEYDDLLLNLAAKTIALKIYFELEEISLLESHLEAMKKFIYRKKIIGYHKENYLHLIAFTKQLLELKNYDKEACLSLKEKIESTKSVAEKTWLLNQIP